MANMSVYFFVSGTIIVACSFLLYVGYLLRRTVFAPGVAGSTGGLARATAGGGVQTEGRAAVRAGEPGEQFGRMASILAWMAVLVLALSIVFRWVAAGRAPFSNQFEFAVAFAFSTALVYMVMEARYRLRTLGVFVMPVVLALLLYATTIPATVDPLIPALQNNLLLTIHVAAAVFAYGVFAVAFGAGVMYLLQGDGQRVSWLPPAEVLDQVSYRAVTIGFPLLAAVLVLGAIWGNTAWGRFWGWDPKETSALATWLIYAAYLHTRAIVGWRGKKSAWLLILGFAAVLFTFFGVNLFIGGLHSYSGLQ